MFNAQLEVADRTPNFDTDCDQLRYFQNLN